MEKKLCAFDGCGKPSRIHGFCQGHNAQHMKGQELRPIAKCLRGAPPEVRFMAKVRKTDSCWEWTAHKSVAKGYGQFHYQDRDHAAHRVSWMLFRGEIPEGMTVDHICQNTGCVNPSHLRLATWTQNAQYKRRYKENTKTGIRNVYKMPGGRGYAVYVGKDGEKHYGGYFRDINEADKAAGELRARLFDFKEKPIE